MPPRRALTGLFALALIAGGFTTATRGESEIDYAIRRATLEIVAGRPWAAAAVLRRTHPDAAGGDDHGAAAMLLLAEAEILAGREPDARPTLDSLLDSPEKFVRAQAASHLLALDAGTAWTGGSQVADAWLKRVGDYGRRERPQVAAGYLLAAHLLRLGGNTARSDAALAQVPDGPAETPALLLRAQAALDDGDPKAAAKRFESLLDTQTLFPDWTADWAHLGRARACLQLGRDRDARAELDAVRTVPHLRAYARFVGAQMDIARGDLNGARARLAAVDLEAWDPRLAAEAELLRVQVALDTGRFVEAESLAVGLEARVPAMLGADHAAAVHPAIRFDLDAWHLARTRATLRYLADRGLLHREDRIMQPASPATLMRLAAPATADTLAAEIVLMHPYQHEPQPTPGIARMDAAPGAVVGARRTEATAAAEVVRAQELRNERRVRLDQARAALADLVAEIARLRAEAERWKGERSRYTSELAAQEARWNEVLLARLATLHAALAELDRGAGGIDARYPRDRGVRAHPDVEAARGTLGGAAAWVAALDSLHADLVARTPQRVHDVLVAGAPGRADSLLAARLAALAARAAEIDAALASADSIENAAVAAAEARWQEARAATGEARAGMAAAWEALLSENAAKLEAWRRTTFVAVHDAAATGAFLAAVQGDSAAADTVQLARLQDAATKLERFLDLHPEAERADEMWYRLGEVHLERAGVQHRMALGRLLAAGGDASKAPVPVVEYGEALAAYGKLLELHPESPRVLDAQFNIGFLYSETGLPDVAVEHLQAFLSRVDSTDARRGRAALRLGDVQFALGRKQEALDAFTLAARAVEPRIREQGLFQLGWCAWDLDRYEEARTALRELLDGLASQSPAPGATDLSAEALELLALCFSADHPPSAVAAELDVWGRPAYESVLLRRMARLYESRAQFAEAKQTWQLELERHPLDAGAPGAAVELLRLVRAQEGEAAAHELAAEMAPRFAPGGEWARQAAAGPAAPAFAPAWQSRLVSEDVQVARADSADAALERPEAAAARMAELLRASAVFAHREARGDSAERQVQLARAVERYRRTLALFPGAEGEPTTWLYLGEALFESGHYVEAADACASAAAHAAADSTVRASAAGEELAALDAACVQDSTLLERYDHTARASLKQHPGDAHGLDALERVGEMSFAAGRLDQAASAWTDFAGATPDGRRAAAALKAVGDTWWRRDDYKQAAARYDAALTRARAAGADSLANALAVLVPGALYRAAGADEAHQRADAAAAGYESVATAHPEFEFADQALYRAAHLRATLGDTTKAIADFENITSQHPKSSLVPDAQLEVGGLQAAAGHDLAAAEAYRHFAVSQAAHPQAQASWLRAALLFERGGKKDAADSSYAELLRIVESGADTATAAGLWMRRARLAGTPEVAAARYARALDKPASLPAADRAEALFQLADLRRSSYEALPLAPPLAQSLPPKQQALEGLLARYAEVVELGVEPWHAAACLRVGQCLEHLGAALGSSPAPAEFSAADAGAYRDALKAQSQAFDDRAADAWSQGLQAAQLAGLQGPWREQLESRLYPVLARVVPTRPTPQFVLTPP